VSAEPITAQAASATPRMRFVMRPVVGVLADGTPFFAPVGEVLVSGARVACHLCGRWFRSVTAHLRVHGWTKERYCQAFGLERGQPLEGPETRKLRSAAFAARLVFEPAIRDGSAAGRARATSGQLARDAAAAARGRSFPEQRRRKSARAQAAGQSPLARAASRERADRYLAAVAASVAERRGYPDIGALVAAKTHAGASLAAISREIGLHKDWLSRHLGRLDPVAAKLVRQLPGRNLEEAWIPVLTALGYPDVASYLRARHLVGHQTVNVIAAEIGVSHHAVAAALQRHGLSRIPHAAKRHESGQRATQVAQRLGFPTIASYISDRRARGLTWQAIAAESGQPQTWLRRHAAR
jgi:lambda repressor-like predicted transcriptional regulator